MAKFKAGAAKGKPSAAPKHAEGLPRSIMDSAQQIWLAGMGAFGRAQEEGTKLFETLVREGSTLESKTRRMATGSNDSTIPRSNRMKMVPKTASRCIPTPDASPMPSVESMTPDAAAKLSRTGPAANN